MSQAVLSPPTTTTPALPRRLPLLMASACGVAVANVYFPQALTPLIAHSFGTTPGTAASVATVAQLGYAAGIFALVPLGDRLPRRRLLVVLLALTAAALLAAGMAPSIGALAAASAVVGAVTVIPQLLIPMAAGLVDAQRRGAVIGTLQGGLIGGILLARTFGAGLGGALGWRAPYLVAAVVTGLLAVVLARALPHAAAPSTERYPVLLAQTLKLLASEPDLRRSAAYQATVFAGFSAAWTALALLVTGPTYRLGPNAVGVLALIGAVSMLTTPATGRLVDRHGADRVNVVCILAALASAGVLACGAWGGGIGLAALVAGLVLLDIAVQGNQVANQARIMALRPAARSRINTGYMTCSFLGGSAGSAIGVQAFSHAGWAGVCAVIAGSCLLALATHGIATRAGRPAPTPAAQPR